MRTNALPYCCVRRIHVPPDTLQSMYTNAIAKEHGGHVPLHKSVAHARPGDVGAEARAGTYLWLRWHRV
jgi:hypothetical protein